jgi:hypothetical protein
MIYGMTLREKQTATGKCVAAEERCLLLRFRVLAEVTLKGHLGLAQRELGYLSS